jgi:DNA replication licensing factor MCM7
MRQIGSRQIGSLVAVSGIVTRVTDVKPCLVCACYACDLCGCENYQTVPEKVFMPLVECKSESCSTNRTRGKLGLQLRGSKFTSYQEIKIQECSDQVPMGHVPRMMSVIAKGEVTRHCGPGDMVTITGVFCPSWYSGPRKAGAGVQHSVFLEAYQIQKQKKSYTETNLSEETLSKIEKERGTDIYTRVSTAAR